MSESRSRLLTDAELGAAIREYFDQGIVEAPGHAVATRVAAGVMDRRAPREATLQWWRPVVALIAVAAILLAGYQVGRFVGALLEHREVPPPVRIFQPITISASRGVTAIPESAGVSVDSSGAISFYRGTCPGFQGGQPELTVTQLTPLGTVDTSFGINGTRQYWQGEFVYLCNETLAIAGDGSSVRLSSDPTRGISDNHADTRYELTRLHPDGSVDRSFGTRGTVTADGGVAAVSLLADGRVLIAGSARVSPGESQLAVTLFTSAGRPDAEFGANGTATLDVTRGLEAAYALAVQPDGKVLVVGEAANGEGEDDNDIVIARFNPDGSVDESFGASATGLRLHISGTGVNSARSVATTPDGRILVAGRAGVGDGFVLRFSPDGELDPSFSGDGIVTHEHTGVNAHVAVQPDGKVLVADNSGIVRFNLDGSIDTAFGSDGYAHVPA